ncbi:MAG: N-6 DNA methylase [Chloroflexi bacterium]|nr:N-6 DNA methylase [Chloroflexota bacterium]
MFQDVLRDIFRNSDYGLTIFSDAEVDTLRQSITSREVQGQTRYYLKCAVRNKEIALKPEEMVRQLYLNRLLGHYGYEKRRIAVEHPVYFGRQVKRADIVIFDQDRPTVEYIIIEVKKPKLLDGKNQLRSYCNATGAPMAVWTNGSELSAYHRRDPNYFEPISDIPKINQQLSDILNERFTWRDLVMKDSLTNDRKSLKQIILDMEDEVLANAGVDVFEEVFKLVFTKLYDEMESSADKAWTDRHLNRQIPQVSERADFEKVKAVLEKMDDGDFRLLEFRNTGQSDGQLHKKIQDLFDEAKGKWGGVFAKDSRLELTPSHLSVCVASLQNAKLFNSNLQVVDEAFEYLVNKSAKGEKGQYFTPRHVIDMCVKMLNPQRGEYIIDTAAGSCGFPVHSIFHMTGQLFSNVELSAQDKRDILRVFGIDFDEKVVRVARMLNLIAGDGETNVLYLNTLDYERWDERAKDNRWRKAYGEGFDRLRELQTQRNGYKSFNFGVLMANPPFAGDIKESRIIHKYDLGYNEKGDHNNKVGRDILFIERNLDFLRPGGRMAVVLPQGRFNNISDKRIRDFIAERCRILGVVGLHGNTFKPHTGTKTSVLLVQKWNDDDIEPLYHCPKVENYPIFFAVSHKGGKDNSGEYTYMEDEGGERRLDIHGHLLIDHDLHNHDGALPNGIAEAFVAFAKEQNFPFWREGVIAQDTPNF